MAAARRKSHCKLVGKMELKNKIPCCELVVMWPVLLSPASPAKDRRDDDDNDNDILEADDGLLTLGRRAAAARVSGPREVIIIPRNGWASQPGRYRDITCWRETASVGDGERRVRVVPEQGRG